MEAYSSVGRNLISNGVGCLAGRISTGVFACYDIMLAQHFSLGREGHLSAINSGINHSLSPSQDLTHFGKKIIFLDMFLTAMHGIAMASISTYYFSITLFTSAFKYPASSASKRILPALWPSLPIWAYVQPLVWDCEAIFSQLKCILTDCYEMERFSFRFFHLSSFRDLS